MQTPTPALVEMQPWILTPLHPWPLQLLALLPFDDLKISGKPVVCSE